LTRKAELTRSGFTPPTSDLCRGRVVDSSRVVDSEGRVRQSLGSRRRTRICAEVEWLTQKVELKKSRLLAANPDSAARSSGELGGQVSFFFRIAAANLGFGAQVEWLTRKTELRPRHVCLTRRAELRKDLDLRPPTTVLHAGRVVDSECRVQQSLVLWRPTRIWCRQPRFARKSSLKLFRPAAANLGFARKSSGRLGRPSCEKISTCGRQPRLCAQVEW